MIIDKSNGRFEEVKAFAEKRGLTEQLQERLDGLDSGTCYGKPCDVVFVCDFAPHSMLFYLVAEGKGEDAPWDKKDVYMHGGFIYHGPGDTGAAGPTYSVKVGDTNEGWSVHT